MQLVAQNVWVVHQVDIKTTYLDAPIDSEIYVEDPQAFEIEG